MCLKQNPPCKQKKTLKFDDPIILFSLAEQMAYFNAMDFSPIFNYGSRIFQYSINDHPPPKSDLITHLEPEHLSDREQNLRDPVIPDRRKWRILGKSEREQEKVGARESESKRK